MHHNKKVIITLKNNSKNNPSIKLNKPSQPKSINNTKKNHFKKNFIIIPITLLNISKEIFIRF
jgi:hypothetical protein